MSTLGMSELLVNRDMSPEDKVQACQNALLPIVSGIAVIGDLMTGSTTEDTGYLLAFLANLVLDLQHIEADAQFDLRVLAGKKAKASDV